MSRREDNIVRGDIYYADLGRSVGSRQGGERPVLIIQNNVGNQYSPTVLVAPFTTSIKKVNLPTHVFFSAEAGNLPRDSIVMLEQVMTLDKTCLKYKIGHAGCHEMEYVDRAIMVSFAIERKEYCNGKSGYDGRIGQAVS